MTKNDGFKKECPCPGAELQEFSIQNNPAKQQDPASEDVPPWASVNKSWLVNLPPITNPLQK